MKINLPLLFIFFFMLINNSVAKKLNLNGSTVVELPNYTDRRVAFDGSVCVDVRKRDVLFLMCFYEKRIIDSAWDGGFKRYSEISSDERSRVLPASPEAYFYVNAPYGWYYPAVHKKLGGFDLYEVEKVLCKDDSPGLGKPAACYVAILAPISVGKSPLSLSIGAMIEQPPLPGNEISASAKRRIEAIRTVIASMRIRTFNRK